MVVSSLGLAQIKLLFLNFLKWAATRTQKECKLNCINDLLNLADACARMHTCTHLNTFCWIPKIFKYIKLWLGFLYTKVV